jgi:hypothetical protein
MLLGCVSKTINLQHIKTHNPFCWWGWGDRLSYPEQADVAVNHCLVEAVMIECAENPPTLAYLTDVVLCINRRLGGAVLPKTSVKSRLRILASVEAYKWKMVTGYAKRLARRSPKSRNSKLQEHNRMK